MSIRSKIEHLQTLRANLRHFEESPDFGDSLTVQRIKQILRRQIAEAESYLDHLTSRLAA
jgi:hypothetical protein